MDNIVQYYNKNFELYSIFTNPNHIHGEVWNIMYDGQSDIVYVMFADLKYIKGQKLVKFHENKAASLEFKKGESMKMDQLQVEYAITGDNTVPAIIFEQDEGTGNNNPSGTPIQHSSENFVDSNVHSSFGGSTQLDVDEPFHREKMSLQIYKNC